MPALRSPTAEHDDAAEPVIAFRLRITAGDAIAVGPGKIAVLEAIDQTGSIVAAAKALGMSYRRAWLLLDQLNRSLAAPAVASAQGGQRGGGSVLTDVGRRVIRLYRTIERTAAVSTRAEMAELVELLAR